MVGVYDASKTGKIFGNNYLDMCNKNSMQNHKKYYAFS